MLIKRIKYAGDIFEKLVKECEWDVGAATAFLEAIPDAEAEPVRHGRWEPHYEVINGELIPSDKKHVCSECKDIWETSSKLNYCPYCGAKMDKEDGNETP